ncbi:MAG TPA: M56 family metallopeptidase [Gammaproteobacteria bacterium]|nr:M56 family metallopeptidase [Gammaproteobacteria bacterium]
MDTQAAILAGGLLAGILAKGALLLAVAAMVSFCLRRRASAAVRHAVWHLAFVGLLVLPLIAALGPTLPLPSLHLASAPVSMTQAAPSQEVAPVAARSADSPTMADVAAVSLDSAGPSADNPTPRVWLIALLLAWALGAAALLARLGYGLMRIARLSRRADAIDDANWQALAGDIAEQLGLRRKVTLRCHRDIEMPMTFGVRRPVILLPAGANGWAADKRRLVLLHELAHVRRGDALTQLVMQIARALHWPNPLAWAGARRFLLTREQACDDRVIRAGAQPSDYAGQLLEVARGLRSASAFAATPAMAEPSELRTRIQSILDEHCRRRGLSRPGAITMAALAFAIVLPLAALRPAAAATETAATVQSNSSASTAQQQAAEQRERAMTAARERAEAEHDKARAKAEARREVALTQRGYAVTAREKAAEKRAKSEAKRAAAHYHHATDPQTQIQERAVFALSQLPAKQSVPRLIEIAKSNGNEAVREKAVFWLGQIGSPKAAAFLNQLIASDAPLALREKALFGISQLPKNSVPLLIKIAKHGSNQGLREKAIFWLGQSHDPRAAQALMDIVQGHSK